METLTRHSWIHYTVCWIVKLVHGNIDQTLVNSLHGLLNSEIGGLMCHVITTEYRTRVHCIHMYHFAMQWSMWFISWFLVNIFVFNTTVQLGIIPETFFLFFSKNFYLFYNDYSTSYTIMLIGTDFAFRWSFIFATNKSPNLNFLNIMFLPQGWRDIWNSCFGWTKSRLGRCTFMHKPTRMIKL